jgi:hypothetical protein
VLLLAPTQAIVRGCSYSSTTDANLVCDASHSCIAVLATWVILRTLEASSDWLGHMLCHVIKPIQQYRQAQFCGGCWQIPAPHKSCFSTKLYTHNLVDAFALENRCRPLFPHILPPIFCLSFKENFQPPNGLGRRLSSNARNSGLMLPTVFFHAQKLLLLLPNLMLI